MSAFTVIRLDTTPPVITWGPVTDAVASETMTVLYLLDEPQITAASFRLVDGRVIPGTVAADRITVDIPGDAPEGTGVLTAQLVDDVGNATVATLNIHVTGEIAPGPPPIPTLPGPPMEEPWRTRSRCVTRSRYRLLATRRLPSRATIRSRTRVEVAVPPRSSATVAVSRGAVRTHVGSKSTVIPRERWTLTKRPEGPDAEDELILLGIL